MLAPNNRALSITVETPFGFNECLGRLRTSLRQVGFSVVAEVSFDRQFKEHLGVDWGRYTVVVVWSPFHAYQGVLNDAEAGILLPFHFVVAEKPRGTLVAATNLTLLGQMTGRIGLRLVGTSLMAQVQEVFDRLHGAPSDSSHAALFRGGEDGA